MSHRRQGAEPTPFVLEMRGLLERAGLSGREFAAWLGVAKSTAENWLRGAEPHRYTRRMLQPGLTALQRELDRQKPRLPPPITVRNKDRLPYVKRIRRQYK